MNFQKPYQIKLGLGAVEIFCVDRYKLSIKSRVKLKVGKNNPFCGKPVTRIEESHLILVEDSLLSRARTYSCEYRAVHPTLIFISI